MATAVSFSPLEEWGARRDNRLWALVNSRGRADPADLCPTLDVVDLEEEWDARKVSIIRMHRSISAAEDGITPDNGIPEEVGAPVRNADTQARGDLKMISGRMIFNKQHPFS